MTKSVFSTALLLLGSLWMAQDLKAEERKDFTKIIKKEFSTSATGSVDLYNRYGRVDVKSWNQNKVKIEVTILVKANSEKDAQEVFDRISINFFNNSNYVKAETEIASANSSGFFSWWGSSSRADYTINYDVYVPEANNLMVSNRYGNVFVGNTKGKTTVDVKYGNANLEGLQGPVNLTLGYGKGSVKTSGNVALNSSYSTLTLGDVRDVDIESKYSKVTIDRAAIVRSDSRYDNYALGHIEELRNTGRYDNISIQSAQRVVISTRYSSLKVGQVAKILDVESKYGDVAVGTLKADFSMVSLMSEYTGIKIGIEEGAAYDLDAVADYAGIGYPSAMNVSHEIRRNSNHEVKASTGSKGNRGLIKARLRYGSLKLYHP